MKRRGERPWPNTKVSVDVQQNNNLLQPPPVQHPHPPRSLVTSMVHSAGTMHGATAGERPFTRVQGLEANQAPRLPDGLHVQPIAHPSLSAGAHAP